MPRSYRLYLEDILEAIQWCKIAGLRDIVVHNYFGVNLEIIWDTAQNKLPDLRDAVGIILGEEAQ